MSHAVRGKQTRWCVLIQTLSSYRSKIKILNSHFNETDANNKKKRFDNVCMNNENVCMHVGNLGNCCSRGNYEARIVVCLGERAFDGPCDQGNACILHALESIKC
jgi:hypothetical protein